MCQYILTKTGNKCKNSGDPYCTIHKKMLDRQTRNTTDASSSSASAATIPTTLISSSAALERVQRLIDMIDNVTSARQQSPSFVAAPASSASAPPAQPLQDLLTSVSNAESTHPPKKVRTKNVSIEQQPQPEVARQCCVCWEEGTHVKETPCKHGMCRDCFLFLEKEKCPMCRASLTRWYISHPYGQEFKGIRDHFKVLMDKQRRMETEMHQKNTEIAQLSTQLLTLKSSILLHLQPVINDVRSII